MNHISVGHNKASERARVCDNKSSLRCIRLVATNLPLIPNASAAITLEFAFLEKAKRKQQIKFHALVTMFLDFAR
jgi:hypothetical protein